MVSQVMRFQLLRQWRRNWDRITPFFAYPPEIRKVIYWRKSLKRITTNAIESLNMSLRKIIKMRGSFPNDEASFKLLYLALRNASKKWTIGARVESALPVQNWHDALNRFSILWPERMPKLENV